MANTVESLLTRTNKELNLHTLLLKDMLSAVVVNAEISSDKKKITTNLPQNGIYILGGCIYVNAGSGLINIAFSFLMNTTNTGGDFVFSSFPITDGTAFLTYNPGSREIKCSVGTVDFSLVTSTTAIPLITF